MNNTILTSRQRNLILQLCANIARNQGAGLPLDVLLEAVEAEYKRSINAVEQSRVNLHKYVKAEAWQYGDYPYPIEETIE